MDGFFRLKNGLGFRRLDDGSVEVVDADNAHYIVPPDDWVSVVTHMATAGDLSERHHVASQLHHGTGGATNER